MKPINARSTAWLPITLLDRAGAPAVPSQLNYRIDCVSTGQAVRALTALPPAAELEITLSPNDNRIIEPTSSEETRRVTVVASYGSAGDQVTGQIDYVVSNLPFVGS